MLTVQMSPKLLRFKPKTFIQYESSKNQYSSDPQLEVIITSVCFIFTFYMRKILHLFQCKLKHYSFIKVTILLASISYLPISVSVFILTVI